MNFSKDLFFYRTLPHFALEVIEKYLRIEVEGEENLPANGKAILVPNHSGFSGLDALLLSHWIYKSRRRIPRILLHRLFFFKGVMDAHARKFGFLKASYRNGLTALRKNNIVILFPEAERGNFKPINERYRLQDFKSGFIRMAHSTGAPVIPVLIIGAEETHINLGQVKVLNQLLPLPLNLFPLPAKWKIKFLKPLHFSQPKAVSDWDHEEKNSASGVRLHMQTALTQEVSRRNYIYFDQVM